MTAYRRLSDTFDHHDGKLRDYVLDFALPDPNLYTGTHYDIRAFYSEDVTVPWTLADMSFWNVGYFVGWTMAELSTRRSVIGRTTRGRRQEELEVFSQATLDTMTQAELEWVVLSVGNEEWDTGAGITLGRDAANRYRNQLAIDLTTGVERVIESYYPDDLLTDFEEAGMDYFIELTLVDFPAQSDPAHLDIANSYIEFTSSDSWAANETDSIKFDATLNNISAGGDTYFRLNRNSLSRADLRNIKGIRFRLNSTGNMTFKTTAMRLVSNTYKYGEIDINTKRGALSRSVPRDGATEPSTTFSRMYFGETRPKNLVYYAKFNSGHNPVGNDNAITFTFRLDPETGDHVSVRFLARNTQSRIRIYETSQGAETEVYSTVINSNALTESTGYYLIVTIVDNQIRVELYKEFGVFLGDLVYGTGWQDLQEVRRGYVGYTFEPYNYDFELGHLAAQSAEFAAYESAAYLGSLTPVQGAQLFKSDSGARNVLAQDLDASGDATLSVSTQGNPSPSQQLVRTGESWFGGLVSDEIVAIDSPEHVWIEGDVFPVSKLRGTYRVALVDGNMSVGYIGKIRHLRANQWNHFRLKVPDTLTPGSYYLYVHQTGFYGDTFLIDNVEILHDTIAWAASPDNGITWYEFKDALNSEWRATRFQDSGLELKIRARAFSDYSWIGPYKVKPIYAYPGHRL